MKRLLNETNVKTTQNLKQNTIYLNIKLASSNTRTVIVKLERYLRGFLQGLRVQDK